jgi:predicted MPP superfamily phosphohydrolase
MPTTRRQFLKRAALGLGSMTVLDGFAVEPQRLRIVRLDMTHLGLGKTIAHFSDTHYIGDHRYLERIVRTINGHNPDLVFFTGDLVNGAETKHLAEALEICGKVRAPMFGVHGNHDPWDAKSLAALCGGFAATGGRWLMDESVDLGGFVLHGSSYIHPLHKPETKKKLLLCHYPAAAQLTADRPYQLILSGHSHGGQVRIPFLKPFYLPPGVGPYVRGLYDTPLGKLFVSAGVGTTGLPLRFLCPPDIAIIQT